MFTDVADGNVNYRKNFASVDNYFYFFTVTINSVLTLRKTLGTIFVEKKGFNANKAAFTLQVLMHKSDLLTISDFLARLFTFTLDTTGIRYLCLH